MVDEIEVLGHTIKRNQITPSIEKIAHIAEFPAPTNKKQLQQFLGSVNYIGDHIPHIATVQAPLTELTGNTTWEWGALQNKAFDHVKQACRLHLPLLPINYSEILDLSNKTELYLVTDTSNVGVGTFLCHRNTFQTATKNIAAIHS